MTTTDTHAETEAHDAHDEHMSDMDYIKIAIILAVMTAIEVLTYFVDFGGAAIPTLLILMVLKFAIVVAYFMHLKFDNPIFRTLFVAGIVLALAVYAATLTAFNFWGGNIR